MLPQSACGAAMGSPADARPISPHPLFDPEWYRQSNPDIPTHLATFEHYLTEGWRKHRSPHPLFSVEYYFLQRPDVRLAGVEPLGHFVTRGWRERANPHPSFDVEFYLSQAPTLDGVDPLTHYVTLGWRQGLAPSRTPEPNAWRPGGRAGRDLWAAGLGPDETESRTDEKQCESLETTLSRPASSPPPDAPEHARRITPEALDESGLFDADWYLATYPDIARSGGDPRIHFLQFGSAELRSPGPNFDAAWYAQQYPDACADGFEPLAHYLALGRAEGRKPVGPPLYHRWIAQFDELSRQDKEAIRQHLSLLALPSPLAVIRFDSQNERHARSCIERLRGQIFDRWRAVLRFDSSCSERSVQAAREAAAEDQRLSVLGPDAKAEAALAAQGALQAILLASGGALLREHALYMFALAAAAHESCLVYSDEDRLGEDGERTHPIFKPEFSPELFKNQSCLGNCAFVRGENAHLQSLALGFIDETRDIDEWAIGHDPSSAPKERIHVPHVLYHDTAVRDLTERSRRASLATDDGATPLVSIIIPTRDRIELLEPCIASIRAKTAYPKDKLEILVVDNGSREEKTLRFLSQSSKSGAIRTVQDPAEFNFARLNNFGAAHSRADVLVFLNNDTVIDNPLWLKRLVDIAARKDIGAAGAKLLYPDGTVQHGGMVLGVQGVGAHLHLGVSAASGGFQELANVTREVSAVTAACLAMRRELFNELNGFDAEFAVAFNDVDLCLRTMKAGYRNIYVHDAVVIHHESKSRGYDDTPDKIALFRKEARLARKRHNEFFRADPYYNPNLSFERVNALAFPPRPIKPWRRNDHRGEKLRVLMLSGTHAIGHGVPVVIEKQAVHLAQAGHDVILGGPVSPKEFRYEGCRRAELVDAKEAAAFAVQNAVDCIVAHTPPFFSVARWIGKWPKLICYDYGEPPPEFFPDASERRITNAEKRLCFSMADRLLAISAAVQAEADEADMGVIPLGNDHLSVWRPDRARTRLEKRKAMNWANQFVILNVCRFHKGERFYKGVDAYAEVKNQFVQKFPQLASRVVFALCGKGNKDDEDYVRNLGIEVFPNVSDDELIGLYAAADFYVNLSRWEGYNLGIGQALAMGLAAIASDIPAHRAFPIFISSSESVIAEKIASAAKAAIEAKFSGERTPIVTGWENSLITMRQAIEELCRS